MKLIFSALLLLSLLPAVPGQDVPLDVRLSRDQLKELTGPVALYPDPLLSLILPAATFPTDVVLAARFVQSEEDPALADEKPWDESIRGLTRYPDVLTWMDENLEWTAQLGYAYLAQPEDVMDVIQELRAQAHSVGNLVDTPQQRVVREETFIRIVPAEPEYIYVPYYDPEVVYYERPIEQPYITYSMPWLVGMWLTFDFDWRRHRLYRGDWHGDWDYHHRQDRHDHRGETLYINNSFSNFQVWQGDSRRRMASTRNFAVIRDRLRESTLASPTFFRERFDVSERERRAVAVNATVRERDRRGALANTTTTTTTQVDRDRSRDRFDADGRIKSSEGERATLVRIADREKQRLAAETKRREEFRARLAAEGKISERDRDGRRIGGGDGTQGKGKAGPDGRTTERMLPGEQPKPGEAPTIGERNKGKGSKENDRSKSGPDGRITERTLVPGEAAKIGEAPTIGERGKGKSGRGGPMTERTPIPDEAAKVGEAPKTGERGKMGEATKEGDRGKGRVATPPNAPPSVPGEVRPVQPGASGQGKGKGKVKDASPGPAGQPEAPRAELPKSDPPKGRPEVTEMPKVVPAPVIPNDTSKRGKADERSRSDDKARGKASQSGPRNEASPVERASTQRSVPTPPIGPTPQPKQETRKDRPLPVANPESQKPKIQRPQENKKKMDASAALPMPSGPNVMRQNPAQRPSAPEPQVPVVQRPQPQQQVAPAPRPQPQPQQQVAPARRPQPRQQVAPVPSPQPQQQVSAPPRPRPVQPAAVPPRPAAPSQVLAPPKPQQSVVGGKKPQDEEDKKKQKK